MSSGCVLRKVSQLFTCEKNCNSVEARKALLEDFTSKVYRAEVVYVGSNGNIASEEQYNIYFRLSGNQKDPTLNIIHGSAILQKGEDTPINLTWTGTYLVKKSGYKMRVGGENIEKDFYLYCDGNDKINFLIKKTASELGRGTRQVGFFIGGGTMNDCLIDCKLNCNGDSYCESLCPGYCTCTGDYCITPGNCLIDCKISCNGDSYCESLCPGYCKCASKTGNCITPGDCLRDCKINCKGDQNCENLCQDYCTCASKTGNFTCNRPEPNN